jgi:hypothetical protein
MTGCTKLSAGCDDCYAAVVAERKTREVYLRQLPVKGTRENGADPFAPRFWPERLGQPFKWPHAKRVFVNSMSDIFLTIPKAERARPREIPVKVRWPQARWERPLGGLRSVAPRACLGLLLRDPELSHRLRLSPPPLLCAYI